MKKTMCNTKIVILLAAAVITGAYLWQQQAEPIVMNEANVYEDDYLSFEYPDNVALKVSRPLGGRSDSRGIEFLLHNEETNTYDSSGLHLYYLVGLGVSEELTFTDLDEISEFYGQYDLEMNAYSVDQREGLQVVTKDMTGETFFLVIPANQEGDAFRFNGVFMNDNVNSILTNFMETANLKQ